MTVPDGGGFSVPREVAGLLGWLRACTPGTLIPAGDLLERVESLPAANGVVQSAPADEELEHLLTADEVAEWLVCDRQRVYRMARDGQLPSVRVGSNTVRFRRRDIVRWLDRRSG